MKVSKAVKQQKEDFVRDVFSKDISARVSQIQHDLKIKFGHGLSANVITSIRQAAHSARSQGAASVADGLKAAGVRTRINPPSAKKPSGMTDVMMQREVEDLANIIRKRIPGIRKFILLIGDDGKPMVEYSVIANLEGKLQF